MFNWVRARISSNAGTPPKTTVSQKNHCPHPRSNDPNGPDYAGTKTPKGGSGLPPNPLESPLARAALCQNSQFIRTKLPIHYCLMGHTLAKLDCPVPSPATVLLAPPLVNAPPLPPLAPW